MGASSGSWISIHHPLSSGHLHRIYILAEPVHVNVGLHCFSSLNDCLINFKLNYAVCHLPKSLQCCHITILFHFRQDIPFPGSLPYFSIIKISSNHSHPWLFLKRTHSNVVGTPCSSVVRLGLSTEVCCRTSSLGFFEFTFHQRRRIFFFFNLFVIRRMWSQTFS